MLIRVKMDGKYIWRKLERFYLRGQEMAKSGKLIKGLWSKTDIKTLKKLFSNNPTAKVAARLKRPFDAVKKKASRMGLRKTRKYMKSLGRS